MPGIMDYLSDMYGKAKDTVSDAVYHNPYANASGLGAIPGAPQQKSQPQVVDMGAAAQAQADRDRAKRSVPPAPPVRRYRTLGDNQQ